MLKVRAHSEHVDMPEYKYKNREYEMVPNALARLNSFTVQLVRNWQWFGYKINHEDVSWFVGKATHVQP